MRTLRLAWQSARSDPTRSLLSIISLTLGILGLVTVVAAHTVLSDTVSQRALLTGGDIATFRATVTGVESASGLAHYADMLERRTEATASTAELTVTSASFTEGNQSIDVQLVYVGAGYTDVLPISLLDGVWPSEERTLAPSVVVNSALRERNPAPSISLTVGNELTRLHVVGTVADGVASPAVYARLSDQFFPEEQDDSVTAAVLMTGPNLTKSTITGTGTELESRGASQNITEVERIDTLGDLRGELAATSSVLVALGVISLASTLFGTVNLGLATAKSRSREFALRRTLGASRGQISLVTVLESQIVAGLAATCAFFLAWSFFPLIVGSFDVPPGIGDPTFSPIFAGLAFGVSASSALIASLVPALISFRSDISQVMRY